MTRQICVGNVKIGGGEPVVVMDTMISESDEVALLRARAIYLEPCP